MKNRGLDTNAFGYSDPTAYEAIIKADRIEPKEVNEIMEDIFKVCKQHNVYIFGDITFINRTTNKKGRKRLKCLFNV